LLYLLNVTGSFILSIKLVRHTGRHYKIKNQKVWSVTSTSLVCC